MAWQTTMVTMLSIIIEESYTDNRLEMMLATAARYVQQEINLTNTYVINVNTPNITPDPTLTSSLDDIFTNFVVLKAACIADSTTHREMVLRSGIKSIQGMTSLETLNYTDGFNFILGFGPCKMYEDLKKDYQNGNIENIRAVLSPFAGISTTTKTVTASTDDGLGTTIEIKSGYQRVLEFDAQVLDDDFIVRYDAFTNWFKRRFELYSFSTKSNQSFPYGNVMHSDLFKPVYSDTKKAFEFPRNLGGNPNFTNALDDPPLFVTGPLYGDNNDGLTVGDSKRIRFRTRFRVAFDIEFSEDWWTGFQDVVENTTSRWATFWQFKNHTNGYFADLILCGIWDWNNTSSPAFTIKSIGDSSLTLRDKSLWDTNILVQIPIDIGERKRWVMEVKFDDTGDDAYTKIEYDGTTIIEHTGPNCFPITDQPRLDLWDGLGFPDTIPDIRGMYFGHYHGTTPTWSFPGTNPTIWYSNMSYDVEI